MVLLCHGCAQKKTFMRWLTVLMMSLRSKMLRRKPFTSKKLVARKVIFISPGNKPLPVKQSAKSAKGMWDKLNSRYEAATNAHKISLLTSLINTFYQAGKELGNYIVELETCSNWLTITGFPVAGKLEVAVLLVTVMNKEYLKSTVAALKTVDGVGATWDSVCSRPLEERRSDRTKNGASTPGNSQLRAGTVQTKANHSCKLSDN